MATEEQPREQDGETNQNTESSGGTVSVFAAGRLIAKAGRARRCDRNVKEMQGLFHSTMQMQIFSCCSIKVRCNPIISSYCVFYQRTVLLETPWLILHRSGLHPAHLSSRVGLRYYVSVTDTLLDDIRDAALRSLVRATDSRSRKLC